MDELKEYEYIRYKIERVGISRTRLAEMLNVDYNQLNNYLYGKCNISATTKRYLSGFLDTLESIESVYSRNTISKNKNNN